MSRLFAQNMHASRELHRLQATLDRESEAAIPTYQARLASLSRLSA